MKLTKPMLDAAMRKAIEGGLLPRSALREDSAADREIIRLVLEAAMTAGDSRHDDVPARPLFPRLVAIGSTASTNWSRSLRSN